ncbi:glucose PTS transporter subunit EIIB [Streptomyces sp. NPDC014006]|uniref:glucose PTS transporter subunit EIIB n=1 Tax=Streptomyces sp. NPDC014006 TaxID=3364870 RepID=UPI00370252A2
MSEKAQRIVDGLGGAENITDLEACITRLRTEIRDPSVVNVQALRQAGAHGVLTSGSVVQVVVGAEAESLADDIKDML